jgi:hypothetical protein
MLSLLYVRRLVIMAEEHIWIEIEDEDNVILGINIQHAIMQVRAKHLLEELAKDGVTFLAKNVPNYKGYTLEHVDRTDVELAQGPEGIEYEATVGIKAGRSYHPVYANRGTGIFGPFIKQPYTSQSGKLMWFYASRIGRRIGVESVRGQRAQHFLYTTFRELQVFALARMHMKTF